MIEQNMLADVKVALLGFGMWGRNLARNLNQLGVLKIICDTEPLHVQEARAAYPMVESVVDPHQVFSRPDIQGVVIATPAVTHYQLAMEALKAGKHVFVEKPLALKVDEGQQLVEIAHQLGRILMVGHVLEYHPAVHVLKTLISKGELGQIFYLYSHRLNWGKIRIEENSLWSFAPHDIALMLRLLNCMPEEVICHGESYLTKGIADATLTILRFPHNIQAHIFVSWLHPFKEQRFIIVGSQKIAVFDDTLPWDQKLVLYPHRIDWANGVIPIACKADAIPVPLEPYEPLRAECEEFIQAINTGKPPLTDGASGLRVLQVLDLAQRSLEQNRPIKPTQNLPPAVYIHPTAIVDPGAQIGEGTKIWHFAHIMSGAKIGRNCVLGQNTFIGRNVQIGDRCKIQNNVSVYEAVTLEDDVFCGPSMVFTNVFNPRSHIERKHEYRPTIVKQGATLGANCTIVCGVTIGRYAFVGAGAVVTRDVPDYALVVGVPARIVGWMCECGVKLQFNGQTATCSACGKLYKKEGDRVFPQQPSLS